MSKLLKQILNGINKLPDRKSQIARKLIQFGFLGLTLWIGVKFIIFVHQLEAGQHPMVARPPGVESFLPISALISFKYWLLTGIFNKIHPSGLVIFLSILLTGLLLKKGFCSWVCPIGLLSEYLERIHILIFDRLWSLPKWIDYPLRSIKYLLLMFFLWAIVVEMDVLHLEKFIYSPYNKVADIKMLKFFSEMSALTARVMAGLVLLTILFRHFWCRYLCPYGALLGMLSWMSPFKIRRNSGTCIDCEKCTRVCPASIKVHKTPAVFSDECHACFKCVGACPVRNTLYFASPQKRVTLSPVAFAVVIALVFLIITNVARISGYWQSEISIKEYSYHVQHLDDPIYHHARGQVPDYDRDKQYNRRGSAASERASTLACTRCQLNPLVVRRFAPNSERILSAAIIPGAKRPE